jgi:hypothetical protein
MLEENQSGDVAVVALVSGDERQIVLDGRGRDEEIKCALANAPASGRENIPDDRAAISDPLINGEYGDIFEKQFQFRYRGSWLIEQSLNHLPYT